MKKSCCNRDVLSVVPRIETPRLQLRAIFPVDTAGILRLFSNSQVVHHYDISPLTKLEAAAAMIRGFTSRFQRNEAIRWGIFLEDQLVGSCCFDEIHLDFRRVNMGYNLHPDWWGQGIATEACQAIIRLAFNGELGFQVERVQAITVPENARSEQLLKRLSFVHEGLLRRYGFWKGKPRDMNMFALLSSELENS